MTVEGPRQESIAGGRAAVLRAGRSAFPEFELIVLARTPSTQDAVRHAAAAGAAEGYCCVALEQTAGRGRLGRRWSAPAGSALLCSLLLWRDQRRRQGLSLAAGLAAADAIEGSTGVAPRLKWPNDLLAGGAKLGGILTETAGDAVVLGLGINLRVDAVPDVPRVASLHGLTASPPSWEDLLTALLPALGRRLRQLEHGGVARLRPDWMSRAATVGEPVEVPGPAGPVRGTAVGLDDDGALLVETAAGVCRVVAGEVRP